MECRKSNSWCEWHADDEGGLTTKPSRKTPQDAWAVFVSSGTVAALTAVGTGLDGISNSCAGGSEKLEWGATNHMNGAEPFDEAISHLATCDADIC